jgi:hypothetical protein
MSAWRAKACLVAATARHGPGHGGAWRLHAGRFDAFLGQGRETLSL